MSASSLGGRGRVLVVGARATSGALCELLAVDGYACAAAESTQSIRRVARTLQPEAILVSGAGKQALEALAFIRQEPQLSGLPVLADVSRSRSAEGVRRLAVDDWVHTREELTARLEAALRARRLVERDERARLRMEMLLDITQAATSSLELEQILRIAVEKMGRAVPTDRCSVVLVEGAHVRTASVVATLEDTDTLPELDLARYPELRQALHTRQPVLVEDTSRDPLMEEVRPAIAPLGVRSILVQPLICQDDLVGALFLRMGRQDASFGREEQEFAQAAAAALANSIRNARLHTALRRKREELESAYVDRYRELTEANRRLKELNRLKDEFIAVASHDLRAPLQVLLGHGRLLQDGGLEPAQRASVDAMVRQGKKILGLVESLLEKGKGEAARLSLEPRLVDIAELCMEAAGELSILATERRVTLRAECPESLMAIADEVKLHEVLQNLVTNALHHVPEGGQVVVRAQRLARPDGDAARVVVQDDGPGIAPDQLHLVFDRYRHGPNGVGLGLAICKEFVELHGGEIWAETPAAGGCAFVVTLPLVKESQPEQPVAAPPAERDAPREQARVLVVEDEPEVAAELADVLRTRYRVELARDGQEGLAKARALHPDLIVMDVFLPRLDGMDAVEALQSSSDTADIPVILLSAQQAVAEKVRALNLGAVDYLGKPFQGLELLSRAERALQLRRAERELVRASTLLRETGCDPDTGLHDTHGVQMRYEQELSRSRRYRRPLSLGVLQPEGPVAQTGRPVADLLRSRLRTPDVVGHLGAGAFVVVLPECSLGAARATLRRLVPELSRLLGVAYRSTAVDAGSSGESLATLLGTLGVHVPGA